MQIEQAAVALYGPSWKTPLADALDVNVRQVHRWAAGEVEISPRRWRQIARLIEARQQELAMVLAQLQEGQASAPPQRRD